MSRLTPPEQQISDILTDGEDCLDRILDVLDEHYHSNEAEETRLRAAFDAGCASEGTGTPIDFDAWQVEVKEWEA